MAGAPAFPTPGTSSTAQHAATGRTCPSCGAPVPPAHRFCGVCGSTVEDGQAAATPPPAAPRETPLGEPTQPRAKPSGAGKKTMFFGAMQASRAKLVLIKGDGLDGVSFTLAGHDHLAGRVDAPLLFDEDPFLSPTHANFFYRDGGLVVRDEKSVNGVYIRIRASKEVQLGDHFLVGEQLLQVQVAEDEAAMDAPASDGTYYFASPRRVSGFRVVQQLRGGDTGLAYRAQSDIVTLGREGNDLNFPDDPFISGRHAQVAKVNGKMTLTDLNSKNGTFLRIREEQRLAHGDYVFMGQQLLRVEIV